MGEFAAYLAGLNLGPANTVLLLVVLWLTKKKLCQHEEMYRWYIGQRAIAQAEKELVNNVES